MKAVEKLGTLRREIARKVRQVGILRTLQHGASKLFRQLRMGTPNWRLDPFDLEYGTETARNVAVGALDIPDEKLDRTNRYQAVTPKEFLDMMRELPVAHEEFVFLDVGSGKGRALLLASRFPFKEIIGIELSPALSGIAIRNINTFKHDLQKCRNIHVVCGDAVDYQLPPENVIVFLFNPFSEAVMRAFRLSIENSIRRIPRKVYVLYLQAPHRNVWEKSNAFRIVKNTTLYAIYESSPFETAVK